MKNFKRLILLTTITFWGYTPIIFSQASAPGADDKKEIQTLIRQVLNWAMDNNPMDLLPAVSDKQDSLYLGFDLNQLKTNMEAMTKTGFFSGEFMDNYKHLILTLDKNIKGKVYNDWLVGDLPTFGFANEVDPWCNCQEMPEDRSDPWNAVVITILSLDKDKGEFTWTWANKAWHDMKYKCRVTRENGKWKMAYMEGFDYEKGIKAE